MKTLSELLTDLSCDTANIENAKTVEELPNLNWCQMRARQAIGNHVARAISKATRLGYAEGQADAAAEALAEAAAEAEAATIAAFPKNPTAEEFRRQRNAIHDARILNENNGPSFGEMKQRPY